MKLLIVESPNKIQKIKSYLPDWEIAASVGHIRDLPTKELGIDLTKGYKPNYLISPGKQKVVAQLKRLVAKVGKENVYLATDPDREGEAIAFHLCRALGLDIKTTKRITFDAISKPVILKAIAHPRSLDTQLVAAQESRRVIDRLLGYLVSPILWKCIQTHKALSAGRVQSVALRLIVEREEAIETYTPIKALEAKAIFHTRLGESLPANYIGEMPELDPEEVPPFLQQLAAPSYHIRSIAKQGKRISPKPPFTTASLQQAAHTRLKFSVKTTTKLAQSLFEKGFVTYIRTDSPNISPEAQDLCRSFIKAHYGKDRFQARSFPSQSAAQEAHEAIRPIQLDHENFAELSEDEIQLYTLIKSRTLASQMTDKLLDLTRIRIGNRQDLFESTVSLIKDLGWSQVYAEDKKEEDKDEPQATLSHPLQQGESLSLHSLRCLESLKQVPKRFDEATLVRELEKRGIGRPSTYASIIALLFSRDYVKTKSHPGKALYRKLYHYDEDGEIKQKEEKRFIGKDKHKISPQPIGREVLSFLRMHLKGIIEYQFTAHCEAQFDQLAQGKGTYHQLVHEFYEPFRKQLEAISLPQQDTLPTYSYQGEPIELAQGKYGYYARWKTQNFSLKALTSPEQLTETAVQTAIQTQLQQKAQSPQPIARYGELEILPGKYGPYFKHKGKTASIPKWEQKNIQNWTPEQAQQIFQKQLKYKKS